MDSLGTIRRFNREGVLVDSTVNLLRGGWGLTYAGGYLWASDPSRDMIYKISPVSTGSTDRPPDSPMPEAFSLSQASPNPFGNVTTIRYGLPAESHLTLRIYDISGKVIKTLVSNYQKPGYYTVDWHGKDESDRKVASGIYFCTVQIRAHSGTPDSVAAVKMIRLH